MPFSFVSLSDINSCTLCDENECFLNAELTVSFEDPTCDAAGPGRSDELV